MLRTLVIFSTPFAIVAADGEAEEADAGVAEDGSGKISMPSENNHPLHNKDWSTQDELDSNCSLTNGKDQALESACEWARDECGIWGLGNVDVQEFMHGGIKTRGLAAKKSFVQGEIIMCAPKRCWFNEAPQRIMTAIEKNGKCTYMHGVAIAFAEETARGKESFFNEYIEGLVPTPAEMAEYHPAYSEKALGLELPDGWNAWAELFKTVDACSRLYLKNPAAKVNEYPGLTQKNIRDAYVAVATRAYPEVYMVPFLDLVNMGEDTKINVQNSFESSEKDSMCTQATKAIEAGEELTIDYGKSSHDMWSFFTQYGFATGKRKQYKEVKQAALHQSCQQFFRSQPFMEWFGDANWVPQNAMQKAWVNAWSKLCDVRTKAYLVKQKAAGVDMDELRKQLKRGEL